MENPSKRDGILPKYRTNNRKVANLLLKISSLMVVVGFSIKTEIETRINSSLFLS